MVYLDYAASCPVVKYPQQLYRDVLGKGYFLNPNANYAYKEKRLLSEAEDRVKKAIGAKGGKVVFGGTSSQLIENLFGQFGEDTMIISSVYEHDSVTYFANQMDNIDEIKDTIQNPYFDYQLIVCLMGTNNVTGQVMPVKEIGKLCKEHGVFFVCDMTAMIGHTPIPANIDDWCSCAFWSGHKIGTELGIGAMWLSNEFNDWLDDFKLHGTPNLAGTLAMAQAVEDSCNKYKLNQNAVRYGELLNHLIDGLIEKNIDFQLIPDCEDDPSNKFVLAINAIRLPGFNADALQQFLASKQVYISIGGSACAERHDFRILETGYGLSKQQANEVIRISFGENSTVEDIEVLVENICEFKNTYLDI